VAVTLHNEGSAAQHGAALITLFSNSAQLAAQYCTQCECLFALWYMAMCQCCL